MSDSTNTSDALSGGGLDETPSVRRSVSFKEKRNLDDSDTLTKRRNSDIDLQVGLKPFIFCLFSIYIEVAVIINQLDKQLLKPKMLNVSFLISATESHVKRTIEQCVIRGYS